ncbi:cation:proton antiporter [Sneathiella sp.]|jgi:NhaP-type Na+/H+ or K+/H+ antiporter|uniref:cation:proton antiporter n=1 Tax=Sneathiella sp. TaxID=1964365 RepID=UPI0039E6EC3A
MDDFPVFFVGAFLLFIFGLVSRLIEKSVFSGPMFFLAAGVLMGPVGLAVIDLQLNTPTSKIIAELTLVLILFVDASKIHHRDLVETLIGVPARLLGIGLPLTIVTGAIIAFLLFPDLDPWLVVLIALILSPTDAALGQAVISSDKVPQRIRESISIESGLNDGIVLPLVLVCLAVLSGGAEAFNGGETWLPFMIKQLVLGPLIGALVGYGGGRLVDLAVNFGLMESTFQRLASISIALLAYAFAEFFDGNGFIAAFFAGLFLGVKSLAVRKRIQAFGGAEGQMLSLYIFFILGLVGVPIAVPYLDLTMVAYSLLSLTIVRMMPVALSMIGSGWTGFSVLFVGWFGPRGIASILYLLIVVGELGTEGFERAIAIIVLVVVISTFLHGFSAAPMTKLFKGRRDKEA